MTLGAAPSPLFVCGLGIWLPGIPDVNSLPDSIGPLDLERASPASGTFIEKRARRRASPLSRAVADAYAAALRDAGLDGAEVGSIFGSGLGEVTTMLGLLDHLSSGEELSPMAFATSVHSAAAGLISISASNRGFSTSISADHDTPAAALFEAFAVTAALEVPVLVTCADETSPARFVDDDDAFDTVVATLALTSTPGALPVLARLEPPRLAPDHVDTREPLPPRVARNPQVGLLDLVLAIHRKRSGCVRLDRGAGRGWSVEVRCGDAR